MNKEKIQQEFDNYASGYDLTDAKIELKYIHTGKVAENSLQIAKSLGLSEEDQNLSWEIGILHDIGRFEQLRRYDTFLDAQSIDHAQFGADLLFKESLIDRFDSDESRYAMLEKAVRCHNMYRLPEGLSEREMLFCQIIRDADKIDIFRANYITGLEDIYNVTTEELEMAVITPEVYDAFMEGHAVLRELKMSPIDHLVGHLSLVSELVYPESYRMVWDQGYMWKLAEFRSKNAETEKLLEKIRAKLKK